MTVYETNEPKLPARDGMVTAGNDGTGIFFQNTGDDFFNRIIAGVMLKSPMSPPFRLSMILTCMMTLFGFIMAEMLRMAFGPKREPERKELPVSKGAPAIAKSSPPGGVHFLHSHKGSHVAKSGRRQSACRLFDFRHIPILLMD